MAVNKNFVVKNGLEVSTDLIFTDTTNKKVGIGSTGPRSTLDVRGGIAATTINVSGVSTFVGVGTFQNDLYVAGNLNVVGDLVYDEVTGRNINISGVGTFQDAVYIESGIGTIKLAAGIITALNNAGGAAGIITYYGDGSQLMHISAGVGIASTTGTVGYGFTVLKFMNTSDSFNDAGSNIIEITTGGSGSGGAQVSVGTEAPSGPSSGDLWFNNTLGRTYIYYDEVTLGIGTQTVWVDSSPFNLGIVTNTIASLTTGSAGNPPVAFSGDSSTGFFSPGTSQLTFVSSGSSIARINPNGIEVTGIVTATEFSVGTAVTIGKTNGNATFAGIVTATSFVGDITGNVTGTSTGLSGAPSITVTDLTVNGTETIINTNELNVRDKTVGIGSTTTPTSTTQDGAGIIIYGQTQVDFLYDNDKAAIGLNTALSVAGFVTATSFSGDGSALTGVISGIDIQSSDSLTGTAITALNFSGATITADDTVGISTITIAAAGLTTESLTPAGIVTHLDLTNAQDHLVTASGVTTISSKGGTEGESHTVRLVNSGVTTVGFSTYFLWPGGSSPNIPTTSGTISLISFTVQRVGIAGTQLLAGASLDFS